MKCKVCSGDFNNCVFNNPYYSPLSTEETLKLENPFISRFICPTCGSSIDENGNKIDIDSSVASTNTATCPICGKVTSNFIRLILYGGLEIDYFECKCGAKFRFDGSLVKEEDITHEYPFSSLGLDKNSEGYASVLPFKDCLFKHLDDLYPDDGSCDCTYIYSILRDNVVLGVLKIYCDSNSYFDLIEMDFVKGSEPDRYVYTVYLNEKC